MDRLCAGTLRDSERQQKVTVPSGEGSLGIRSLSSDPRGHSFDSFVQKCHKERKRKEKIDGIKDGMSRLSLQQLDE